jgi:hypothetical protein
MAIKIEELLNKKITAKGLLKDITEVGFVVEDEKEGIEETLSFEEIKKLVGKSVAISITNKEEVE